MTFSVNGFHKPHWQTLLIRLGIDTTYHAHVIDTTFHQLNALHQQKHRYYHNVQHVFACFEWVAKLRALLKNDDWLLLAFYFHDAIYDPKQQDNEYHSAVWAKTFLNAVCADNNLIDWVYHAILATKNHQCDTQDTDLLFLLDIDLSILATPQTVYQTYATHIRKEYAHVTDKAYQAGRIAVLQRFLEADIYKTDYFHKTNGAQKTHDLEKLAKHNINWEISQLMAL